MFNAPRRMGGSTLTSSAFLNSSSSDQPIANAAFDPLASSMPNPNPNTSFGEVDPWSAVPSPARSGTPRGSTEENRVPAETIPSEVVSVNASETLNGLINDPPPLYLSLFDSMDPSSSGAIPLSSLHRLLSTSKLPASTIECIVNLTARDQSSVTRPDFFCTLALVALAQSSPISDSDISIERLSAAIPKIPLPSVHAPAPSRGHAVSPGPETPAVSPWDTAPTENGRQDVNIDRIADGAEIGFSGRNNGPPGGAFDTDAERGYWKRLEKIEVTLIPEKEGWFLQKYKVESSKRSAGPLSRRYSDFVWLSDCLIKRYPFRLLPVLPPKRIGPDASFLEQRRKGLQRFVNMVVNHPVIRDDGAVNVFLTEPAFEAWRKRNKVSTEEESTTKRLNSAQELGVPSDLDEKLGNLRDHLPALLASYQKLVVLAERSLSRLQSASADASRIALSLGTVSEQMPQCCFRGKDGQRGCSLCEGVGRGLGEVGESWTRVAEEGERRASAILKGSIEALKTQRDLYVAFRDLFVRHDKLSKDSVDSLRKKVEGRQKKIEAAKAGQRPGWEVEVDKLVASNEHDDSTITSLLARRIFIRVSMWHELALVFHSRQAAQATLDWREFAKDEAEAGRGVSTIWEGLKEQLESMPIE